MEKFIEFTFSVAEGNQVRNALLDFGGRDDPERYAVARRFPHAWAYPVEDESLFGAVWDGDTSVTLSVGECDMIANALYALAMAYADAGREAISDELFDLARRLNDAFFPDEEPETDSASGRADEASDKKPKPLMENKSDFYFYFLEHGHAPSVGAR